MAIMNDLYGMQETMDTAVDVPQAPQVSAQPRRRRNTSIGQTILDVLAAMAGKKTSRDYQRENMAMESEGERLRQEREYRAAMTAKTRAEADKIRANTRMEQEAQDWLANNDDISKLPLKYLSHVSQAAQNAWYLNQKPKDQLSATLKTDATNLMNAFSGYDESITDASESMDQAAKLKYGSLLKYEQSGVKDPDIEKYRKTIDRTKNNARYRINDFFNRAKTEGKEKEAVMFLSNNPELMQWVSEYGDDATKAKLNAVMSASQPMTPIQAQMPQNTLQTAAQPAMPTTSAQVTPQPTAQTQSAKPSSVTTTPTAPDIPAQAKPEPVPVQDIIKQAVIRKVLGDNKAATAMESTGISGVVPMNSITAMQEALNIGVSKTTETQTKISDVAIEPSEILDDTLKNLGKVSASQIRREKQRIGNQSPVKAITDKFPDGVAAVAKAAVDSIVGKAGDVSTLQIGDIDSYAVKLAKQLTKDDSFMANAKLAEEIAKELRSRMKK